MRIEITNNWIPLYKKQFGFTLFHFGYINHNDEIGFCFWITLFNFELTVTKNE